MDHASYIITGQRIFKTKQNVILSISNSELKSKMLKGGHFRISYWIIVAQRIVQTPINADVSVMLLNLLQQEIIYIVVQIILLEVRTPFIKCRVAQLICEMSLSSNSYY